jgi:two-component system sensor histidine kinase HydH
MSDAPRRAGALEIQANRFGLVSRLADDLAHEIKNPLHAMVINLELVKRRARAGDTASVLQRAELVGTEVTRVNTMLDQLLQLLRPMRQGDPVRDLDGVAGEVLPLLTQQARLSHVDLVYEGVGRMLGAPIRRDALKLMLLNLVADALDRVRAGGGRIVVSAAAHEDEIRIEVAAAGAGSPPQVVPRLTSSDPAATAHDPEGTLGLDVVHTLLADTGGTFESACTADGVRFVARIPRRTVA